MGLKERTLTPKVSTIKDRRLGSQCEFGPVLPKHCTRGEPVIRSTDTREGVGGGVLYETHRPSDLKRRVY